MGIMTAREIEAAHSSTAASVRQPCSDLSDLVCLIRDTVSQHCMLFESRTILYLT